MKEGLCFICSKECEEGHYAHYECAMVASKQMELERKIRLEELKKTKGVKQL